MNPGYFTYRPKGWTTISTNDSASVGAVAKYREIQGIWRTYATLDDFSYATGSLTQWNQGELEALRKNKFTEGQIIRISESGEFYLINKTVYDGPNLYPNEDIIIDAEEENQSYFDYFNDSAGALHEITASTLIFPSSSQAFTASYINPLFISESAADYGFGSGDVTDAITGSLIKTASVSLNTITFTKGDTSTFDIIVDTGSAVPIDTGSFATTGSNTFVGTEIISTPGAGSTTTSLIISGSGRRTDENLTPQIIYSNAGQSSPQGAYVNEFHTFAESSSIGIYQGSGFEDIATTSTFSHLINQFTSDLDTVIIEYSAKDKSGISNYIEIGTFTYAIDKVATDIVFTQEPKILIAKGLTSTPLILSASLGVSTVSFSAQNTIIGQTIELVYKFKGFKHS